MFSILSSTSAPHHLAQLRHWLVTEWGKIDPFDGNHPDLVIPAPLLALDGESLIGGLSFSTAPVPEGQEIGVWINTVFVVPEFRRQGIGSQLIQNAAIEATKLELKNLFVYSEFPNLYQQLGWSLLACTDGSDILTNQLPHGLS